MTMRSLQERAIQTVSFEIGGILLAVPLYRAFFDAGMVESTVLMTVLAVAVLVWSPIHNRLFDWAELRLANRVASDRQHGLRVVHAISHETTSVIVTTPLIMVVGGHGFWEALAIDIGLAVFYAVYAYVFHVVYDHVRPVRPAGPIARALAQDQP